MTTPGFEEVYEEYRAPILALCLHITRSRSDAEDAFQDTFLGVARGLSRFRGDSAVYTWVYRIAIRCALRVAGKARRDSTESTDVPDEGATLAGEQGVRIRDVSRALETLSAPQRLVLGLFAIEGLTHDQIAAILNIPVGTVWSRLHAARKRLASALASADMEGKTECASAAAHEAAATGHQGKLGVVS